MQAEARATDGSACQRGNLRVAEETMEAERSGNPVGAFLILVVGWLVPGMGHLLQRRWRRALVFFFAVGTLAIVGYLQRGFVFSWHTGDIFDLLGFLADFGTGIFYFASHWVDKAGPDISRATGDYGTRFIAAAGVLNLLCALDAYELFRLRRE